MAAVFNTGLSPFLAEISRLKKQCDQAEQEFLKASAKEKQFVKNWRSTIAGRMGDYKAATFKTCECAKKLLNLSEKLLQKMRDYKDAGRDLQKLGEALDVTPMLMILTRGNDDATFAAIVESATRIKALTQHLSEGSLSSSESDSEASESSSSSSESSASSSESDSSSLGNCSENSEGTPESDGNANASVMDF